MSSSEPETRSCRPVQTSAVYLLGSAAGPFSADPPPSPPSPITPAEPALCSPITELSLDAGSTASATLQSPPDSDGDSSHSARLAGAVHVLHAATQTLKSATALYSTCPEARNSFSSAVATIVSRLQHAPSRGKLVLIGVGKSGFVARKLAATFSSLGLPAIFMHPTEALHGDLGMINPSTDVLLFITYSGRTAELLALLPHLDRIMPLILLTGSQFGSGAADREACEIIRRWPGTIALPAPVHEEEVVSFGVAAPTTSTSVAMAVGDALAVVAAREAHTCVPSVFQRNHPGGAIGEVNGSKQRTTLGDVAVRWEDIPALEGSKASVGEVLRVAYQSSSGWVRVGDAVITPEKIRRFRSEDLAKTVDEMDNLITSKDDFVAVAAETQIRGALEWLMAAKATGESGEVLSILSGGDIVGVMGLADLIQMRA